MSKTKIKKHFFTGVLATLPLFATIYILYLIYKLIAGIVRTILPIDFITEILVNFNEHLREKESFVAFLVFLVNIIIFIVVVYIIGALMNSVINFGTTKYVDRLMNRIPIAKTIYGVIKQISDVFFSKETITYKKVVLIEYPRDGIYSLGLVANEKNEAASLASGEEEVYNVFIPGTPNPTIGFYVVIPRNKVIEVDYTVEEAMKLIISAGALEPKRGEKIEKN